MPLVVPSVWPEGKVRQIIDLFKAQLRQDQTLKRAIRTWQIDGCDEEVLPDQWTAAMFPALRLDIAGLGGQWKNQVTQNSSLTLTITLGLKGTDPRDPCDAWEAVLAALYPADRVLISALAPLGVFSYTVSAPGVTRRMYSDGSGQVVQGTLSIPYEYRTAF